MADDCQECEQKDNIIKDLERERDSLRSQTDDLQDVIDRATRILRTVST